jgi:hypothetical protein
MKDDELIATVKYMRTAQKNYFRDRSPQNLNLAKDLERTVDKELERREQKETQKQFENW